MSDYWKKKMDELNKSNAKSSSSSSTKSSSSSSNYWDNKMSELEESKKKKKKQEDIAPVVTTKKEDDRKWFQKGAFEDGYQFGDVTKTILGTLTDTSENLATGVVGMGEKVVDAGAYLAGGLGKLFQADDFVERTQKFISKDLYDEEKIAKKIVQSDRIERVTGIDGEDSIFGEKTDSLMQSAGELGGTIALQAVGVPWFVTTGLTSFGGEVENAFNQGASYGEAGLSSAITMGAEILTEKISGGISFGGKTLDDALTKNIARNISNKTVRTLSKLGIDMFGEGAEEVLSGTMSAIGQKITYADDKELTELFSKEDAFESFIGGAVLGGGMSGIHAAKSARHGVDYVSGLTENEQKVIDKEYENRVAAQEKDGEKLSEQEKSKIYDAVVSDMEKGYISTDTIEEVLGGDTFKSYRDTVDNEDALAKEFEELGKKQNATLAEQSRYNDLKSKMDEIKQNSQRNTLKSQLSEEVMGLVQNDRLAESYNERARRGQAYEADLTKYNEKQQAVIQKAVDSGILNNTRRTHEFVDMIAKISADKGVLFDFTNNEKLKGTSFAVDGKTVNGFVKDGNVTLNIDSAKSLNSVVGHEITHVLEGTELYAELQTAVMQYAKTKSDYRDRVNSVKELYKDIEGADVASEMTADLIGDYLFTDPDFINNLSTEHRNVFQKIYDEIKYLCKVATAGSKEARELEKVKRAFEKAYREGGKQTDTKYSEADTKYSLVTDKETIDFLENQDYIVTYKAMQVVDGKLYPPMSAQTKETVEYTDKKGNKKTKTVSKWKQPSELGKWQQSDENPGAIKKFNSKGVGVFDLIKGNGKTIQAAYNPYEHTSNIVLNDQFEEAYNRDNLVTVEYHIPVSELTSGYKAQYAKDAVGLHEWKSGPVAKDLKDPRKVYLTRWSKPVRILPDSEVAAKYKEILDGTGLSVPFNVVTPSLLSELEKAGVSIDYEGSPMYKSIQKRKAEKEVKYSVSDSDGKQLTKEQQEYFKDSKMRNDNGDLMVMYHGSQDAGFHVFDASMSDDNTSFFFVDRNDVAASYSGTTETYEAKTIRTAEDMNNFLAEIGHDEDYSVIEQDGKFTLLYDGDRVAQSDTAPGIYKEFCWYEGVGEGDANYKVYLNLKNPLVVDAQNRNWNNISREYSQEVADRYHSLTAEEKAALTDIAGWGEISVFRDEIHRAIDKINEEFMSDAPDATIDDNTRLLADAYKKLNEPNMYDLFSIAEDNFSEESIKRFAVKQMNTRDYAQRAKEQGYDGVIFKNIHDNGGYSNGSEGASTVAIAFESNQIKSVANEKPTEHKDIRYSLSDSDGRQLSEQQAEYFKDSKARDDNGNLQLVYHGTRKADFTVFNRTANFYTDSKETADSYAPSSEMYEGYVNITKPFIIDAHGDRWSGIAVDNDLKRLLENYGSSTFKERGKWRTSSDDIVAAILDMVDEGEADYDGVIIRNVDDTGSYFKGEGGAIGTDYITFSSSQFKNADNLNPTSDPDIRFSLSKPVEETKDLMALHNLQSSELMKTLDLGGLPMPSIAVIKAEAGHDQYGDVSLILPKETIDPKANKYNKVYGGDAWTPVYPKIEYKPNEKVAKKISDKYYGLAKEIGYDEVRPFYRYVNELEDSLNRDGGEAAMLEKLYEDTDMMNVYLQDSGKGKVEPIIKETVTEISEVEAEMNQFLVDAIGEDLIKSFKAPAGENPMKYRAAFMEQHESKIRDAYKRYFMEVHDFTAEEADNVMSNTAMRGLMKIMREAYMYTQNNGVTVKTETDRAATREAIRNAAADGYKAWVDGLFKGVEGKSGIRNNQDYYTRSGNPRSWDALHWENTLENVVKAMKGQEDTGTGSLSPYNSFASLSHKRYGSIAEIKADSNRLRKIPEDEYEALNESFSNRFAEIANSIKDPAEHNQFMALDHAAELIVDAVRTQKTKSGMLNYLRKWNSRATEQTVDDVLSLVSDIANMPTGYFEAKPKRAVGFEEVGVFVIPNNIDVNVKQELLNRGYSIAEYDPNVEGDRTKVLNQFEEYKFSLSDARKKTYGTYNVYGKDIALQEVAPVAISETKTTTEPVTRYSVDEMFPDDLAPAEYDPEQFDSLEDADAPPEMEAPYYGEETVENVEVEDPFEDRDWDEVGSKKVKAYMYENPEVKPFFQAEAKVMLGELRDTTKGERWYNDKLYYDSGGEEGFGGTKRHTSADIAYLLDEGGFTYAEIEKGLKAIIEDNGAENIAAAKRIEFILNDRLLNGYQDFWIDHVNPPDQDYIKLLNEKQITEYSQEAFDIFMEEADKYAPPISEEIAPVAMKRESNPTVAIKPKREKQPKLARATPEEQARAEILTEEPKVEKKKPSAWSMIKNNVLDKGMVFEDLSLATGNRELQARWNSIRYANNKAQRLMEKGNASVSSLKSIRETVEKTGKTKEFYEYLYHLHNADRMTLADRYEDTPNKPVFGDSVTAEMSLEAAKKLERANPRFKLYAKDVYDYMGNLRELLVENGVISRETAKLWSEMYPHYVPIRRVGDTGLNINVPLDTGRTGINAPIKRATGGSRDILPLFDTMGQRTMQTYKAIAKNRFGVELKNTLRTTIADEDMSIDEAVEGVDAHEELLQEGKNGKKPTFTVFEDGKKVTFEITEEMYNAMKPASEGLSYTNKVLNTANNIRRGLLTEYNPAFMLTNPIKDTQDVLINSQHPARTYANYPRAVAELIGRRGHWYQEYMDNGGERNTYFEQDTNTFAKEKGAIRKIVGFPLDKISDINNFIERVPRLAEYIASRKNGQSVDVAMLDAARVTTNFAAGGDLTKFLNRNGATFLNASVQGFVQQVRNVREAKANGLKGALTLATKLAAAGLPAMLLNHLLWDDDEEYAELSDYVKQNYYVVGKYDDGKFVRIPKGRALAVIQNAFEQMENMITGDDELDLATFGELLISNLAPNNPLDNHIFAPIAQAWSNRTWYGDDLVPTRLQDLPAAEQYDETTDEISKWLGEKTNLSPYKLNYLLDQYSGGVGDMLLPRLTLEAERGDNSMIAPLADKFTTDGVLKNQNVSDFYDTMDELNTNAKSSKATDEDVLKQKYMNAINSELSELYAKKREVQNGDLPDDRKYEEVRSIQQQIVDLTRDSLNSYEDVTINGKYARVGDVQFRWYEPGEDSTGEPGWKKLTDKQSEKQDEVTSGLGIDASEYWSNKEEYDYAYESPEKYAVAKSVGGYEAFRSYTNELYDIKADKDENGDSIRGSRKEKVLDWINNLDADYGTKIILFKNEYNADDTYNYEIIEYLNSREDISGEEMETILKELGFDVSSDGTISW